MLLFVISLFFFCLQSRFGQSDHGSTSDDDHSHYFSLSGQDLCSSLQFMLLLCSLSIFFDVVKYLNIIENRFSIEIYIKRLPFSFRGSCKRIGCKDRCQKTHPVSSCLMPLMKLSRLLCNGMKIAMWGSSRCGVL